MRLSELQAKLAENKKQVMILRKQISTLIDEDKKISTEIEKTRIDYFRDFIEIGSTYTNKAYMFLSGVRTGNVMASGGRSPNLSPGHTFEFIKKNQKSIVIRCISQSTLVVIGGVSKINTRETGWIYRIDIDSLYRELNKDENFSIPFQKYVNRRESLDILGI